jgi:hypothetical protein
LALYCGLLNAPDGVPIVALAPCYNGPLAAGEEMLRPLRAFGPPVADLVQPLPYPAMQRLLDAAVPPGLHYYWKSSFVEELSDEAIDTLVAHANRAASPLSFVLLEYYGGAASRVGERETTFPYREPLFGLIVNATWANPAETETHVGWARGLWAAAQSFVGERLYSNVMLAEDSDRVRAAYGVNYDRLVALKNCYDPTNVFRLNLNIRPTV